MIVAHRVLVSFERVRRRLRVGGEHRPAEFRPARNRTRSERDFFVANTKNKDWCFCSALITRGVAPCFAQANSPTVQMVGSFGLFLAEE